MTALIKTTELSQREGNLIEHYAFQLDSNENMLFQEERGAMSLEIFWNTADPKSFEQGSKLLNWLGTQGMQNIYIYICLRHS